MYKRVVFRRLTIALACAILAACANQAPRPVGIKVLSADLVFGIPPVQEPVAPPNVIPVEADIAPEEVEEVRRAFVARTAPESRCPQAPDTAFPEQEAPTEIKGLPKEGSYKWVMDGYVDLGGTRFPLRNVIQTHLLTDLTSADPAEAESSYEWKMVQPEALYIVTQTFMVDKVTPQQEGLKLVEILRDPPGNQQPVESFRPNPPIMLLPNNFGVGTNAVFRSAGVDPETFQALEHTAFVLERRRVDACGEILDAWFVDGQQELIRRGERIPINFDYYVATDMGGLIVQSVTESPCQSIGENGRCNPEGKTFINAHIGQVEPGPKLR